MIKNLVKIPAFGLKPRFLVGWDLGSNVKKYNLNSSLQRDWAFDLIGKYHRFTGNEEILDIGSGDGKISYLLSRLGGHVIGVDLSPEMVAFARNYYGHHSNLLFMQDNEGEAIGSFEHDSFDLISAFCMLHLVGNPSKFLGKLRLLLEPEGKMIFTFPMTNNPYFLCALKETCDKFSFSLPTRTREQVELKTLDGMKTIAEEAGFTVERLEVIPTRNAFASRDLMIEWFEGTFSANIDLPPRMARKFNTYLVDKYLRLDPNSGAGSGSGFVYYCVDRMDGLLRKGC